MCFRINGGVKEGFIMSPWLFNVYIDAVMVEMGMGRRGGESRDYLAFCIQMMMICVVSQRKTYGRTFS